VTKIYVVTAGEYSDYRIEAVFSTKNKAKKFIRFREKNVKWIGDGYRVEKYLVDIPIDHWISWIIDMKQNGDTDGFEDSPYASSLNHEPTRFINYFHPNHARFSVRTDKLERALKVANEMRQKILAAGFWGDRKKTEDLMKGEGWVEEE